MSIFGALYSSVSGIKAQGTAIGIISDNISNVNTVGYKAGSKYFDTLVTGAAGAVAYSEGGVRAQNRQLIDKQGTIQSTSSPLDVAINGSGMFVVQSSANATDTPITSYTRAGSFRADSVGNFVNASGLYLKAWPLDANGAIPANYSSLNSLDVVNIGSATGAASATTKITYAARLNSSLTPFPGGGVTGKPGSDLVHTEDKGAKGDQVLVPNANLQVGDSLRATVNGSLTYDFTYGGFAKSTDIAATPIFGASTQTGNFSSGIDPNDSFTITRSGDSSHPITFTYKSSPVTTNGEFNSLQSLADAINGNGSTGLTARVATVGGKTQLYVSADDAREGLTFTNSPANTGATDLKGSLGLTNFAAVTTNRFNTMDGLADLITKQTSKNVTATVNDPNNTNASISINNNDPLTTLQFSNVHAGMPAGTADFLAEFGFPSAAIQASYDGSANSTKSMASGNVAPQYSSTLSIYDSLGEAHTVQIGFIKVDSNTWRAEVYAEKDDMDTGASNQIASGKIQFNTDGSLASIDSTLTTEIGPIAWSDKAVTTGLSIDFGKYGPIGTADNKSGLSEASGPEAVSKKIANGAGAGLLNTVNIDKDGYIVANFTNGQTQKLYKIPLADFSNPNGLTARNGNTYLQTSASGEVNLKESGSGGVGSISPSSLEGSNTELSDELTDMIVAQRAYQASTKVITTASQLLDELNRIGGN